MEERNGASNPAYPILWGKGGHALQTCLPPLVGGRGTTKWWKGAAEGGIIKTAAKPPPPPSEPGPRSGPSSRPLPSRCARHPPPGRGWAGNMEEKNVALKPCLSHFVGGKETTPFKLAFPIYGGGVPRPSNLPPTARRGEGDHEVVEGGRRRRSGPRWSILSMLCPVHPFPLRGTSPQGETRKYVALDIVSHMTQKANPVTLTL